MRSTNHEVYVVGNLKVGCEVAIIMGIAFRLSVRYFREYLPGQGMLPAKQQLPTARTDRDRTFLENKCAALDRQIDQAVYQLYELTPEEIAVIENA